MSKRKSVALLLTGILLGAAISGPAVRAGLQVGPSSQKFYANGEQVQFQAYNINGSNYVRLRDVGKAVGFEVEYDAATDSVYIGGRPMEGYRLANGEAITEENVLALLRDIEEQWPTGTVWGGRSTPGTYKNEVPSTEADRVMRQYGVSSVYGCSGYAAMVSSLLFGDSTNAAHRLDDLQKMRPGDIVFWISNDTGKTAHVVIALETPDQEGRFHITDGNHGETIAWPDPQSPYGRDNLDCYQGETAAFHLEVWTRYPEDVPCTGDSAGAWRTGNAK